MFPVKLLIKIQFLLVYKKIRFPIVLQVKLLIHENLFFFFFFYFSQCSYTSIKMLFTPKILGPVVQIVVSLISSLRAISLTILADSIYNFQKFFAEKNVSSFCTSAKATRIFSA